jgi:steroid delta-isomerase
VTNSQSRDNLAWLEWEFHLRMRKRDLCIEGTSRLVFGEDGRIIDHRDFWDATELFAHMAFIGPLVRLLKRKLSADHQAGANL